MIVLAMSNVLSEQSSILFNISWVVASKLTSEQLIHTHKLKVTSQSNRKATDPSSYDQPSNQPTNPSHNQINKPASVDHWTGQGSEKVRPDEFSLDIDPIASQTPVAHVHTGLTPPPRPSPMSKE
ncbi:hypothetical protein K493DRAFT_310301, partial [Basidiobolus meristosporus CBS 931.73]